MFQREWYRLSGEGKLSDVDMGTVPDIYVRNQQLGAKDEAAIRTGRRTRCSSLSVVRRVEDGIGVVAL